MYLYLVRCYLYNSNRKQKWAYKIGVTDNFDNRLKQLQTGNPHEILVTAVIPMESKTKAFEVEAFIIKEMTEKGKHIRGEWFTSIRLKDLIRKYEKTTRVF